MTTSSRLLLISGSLRAASTNTAVLRTAAAIAPPGTSVTLFEGLAGLPHFDPDQDTDPPDPAVARLRAQVEAADAVLLSTPEYAGGLPGSFKNLLDWLVGGVEITGKPIAWINASSSSSTGAAGAHASLRTVLGYVNGDVVDSVCAHIPVRHGAVGADGTIAEPAIRDRIAAVVRALVGYVAGQRTVEPPVTTEPPVTVGSAPQVEWWQMVASEAIRDLVARYNANGDSGRFAQVVELFAPDAVMELDDGRRRSGRDEIMTVFTGTRDRVQASGAPAHIRHMTATHQIDLIDPSTARGRCYYQVLTTIGLDHWGRYIDEYRTVEGVWRFARRRVTVDGRSPQSLFPPDAAAD